MAWCGQRTMYTPKHACETRKVWQNSGERARQRRSGWTGTYNAEGGLAHTGRRPTSPPSHLAIAAGVVHDEPLVLRQQAVLQQQWVIPLHGRSGHATGHPSPTSAGHKGAKGRGCACKHVFRFFLVCFRLARFLVSATCCLPSRQLEGAVEGRPRAAPASCPCTFAASFTRHRWTWSSPCTRCCGCARAQRQCT